MRTSIYINDTLMAKAMTIAGYKTKKETIEVALKLLLTIEMQNRIKKLKGKLKWEGDLNQMRLDK